jgi:hypothetical protein
MKEERRGKEEGENPPSTLPCSVPTPHVCDLGFSYRTSQSFCRNSSDKCPYSDVIRSDHLDGSTNRVNISVHRRRSQILKFSLTLSADTIVSFHISPIHVMTNSLFKYIIAAVDTVSIFSSQWMLHKDYCRKCSVGKKNLWSWASRALVPIRTDWR